MFLTPHVWQLFYQAHQPNNGHRLMDNDTSVANALATAFYEGEESVHSF